ncbi:hypothetical protein LLEC1_01168, partial [Akanthomyces lecanii]
KRWQDGKLKYHSFNKKVMVYDDRGHFVGDSHWDQEGDLAPGDELSLDRGMALVQVEDCTGEKQQDLTELLDKRAREVEKRRQIAAAKTRPTPRGSLAGGVQPPPQHRPHLALSSLVQSPGPIGRAAIPAHSPFEARQQRLHQNQPPNADAQPTVSAPPAKKRRTSTSPPSKAGFARNLFGTMLNLSSCPGPELLAARARALRQRMLSQAEALSTPHEDEGAEEQAPMQSSPLFSQDEVDATPSRPTKEQRSTLQSVTRHPITSARSVMREAEEVGNRNAETTTDKEATQEKAPQKHRKETQKQKLQTAAVDLTTQDADLDAEPIIPEKSPKKKKKDKESSQSRKRQQTEGQLQETRKQKPTATRRSPSPDLMVIDEPDEAEEAPRQPKATKESRRRERQQVKVPQEAPVPVGREPKAKEPRTTLRMRSRQKRGLLMMRDPSPPPPEPPAYLQEEIDDTVAKTPSPEPSVSPPRQTRSASPEEVTIPSSAPPVEHVREPAPVDDIPTPAPPEPSSEDDLPRLSKRRARTRRTYSPPPEPDVSEEEPRKKMRRQTTKRNVCNDKDDEDDDDNGQSRKRRTVKPGIYEDETVEEEKDPQPRKRRAAKRSAYNEEMGSELEEEEDEMIPAKQGPRIAKLPRKGIRSREILGYVAQGIETLIPGPFASGSFQLGGPPLPTVGVAAPVEAATFDNAPGPRAAAPVEPVSAACSPMPEQPAKHATVDSTPQPVTAASPTETVPVASSSIEKNPAFSSPRVAEEPAIAPLEGVVMTTISSPPDLVRPQAIAAVSQASESITTAREASAEHGSHRNAALGAPPPAVRSNSSSNAVAPTTAEANETKLETLSAPDISFTGMPRSRTAPASEAAASFEIEKSPDTVLQATVPVPIEGLPTSESSPLSHSRQAEFDGARKPTNNGSSFSPKRTGGAWRRAYKQSRLASSHPASLLLKFANLDHHFNTASYASSTMTSSSLPQGFSIFQPTVGAQLQFYPAVGTQELDELIHAHLVGPASSQEKRATLALDFLEHAQLTGQNFKFYAVRAVAASPATSASSSFNTSPTTTSWDWSQNSRAASVSSRSSQHRVSKPASPASRVRATDFSSIPGMKIMTKDGLDVTNSASRGSKTKEQRDHAHLMRIIKACDSCKRKKIRCDPSHKKRGAASPAAPAATAKVAKKARTNSHSAASQSISPPQSVSPPVMVEDFGSFSASPFDMDASFSFDALDTFAPALAPAEPWDEFIQYPPMGQAEDYDFFADPESFLSSQSSDADMLASRLSVAATSPGSGAPPGRGPDTGRAESHTELLAGAALPASVSAQLPYESPDSAGDYADFNLYSPGSSFSEDERMLDIGSSTSGLSTQSMPSPVDSPRRPPNAASPDVGTYGVNADDAAQQPPFTRAEETDPSDRSDVRDATAGGVAGALSVLSRSDVVMRTNEQGQLIICCPPGTIVVNSSGQGSTNAGLANVSPIPNLTRIANPPRLTFWKVSTVDDSSNSSFYIPRELSVRLARSTHLSMATNPMKELAVASVSAGTGNVDATVSTWLDHGSGGHSSDLSTQSSPTQLVGNVENNQPSRFVHRNTDLAQPLSSAVLAEASDGFDVSTGLATGLASPLASTSPLAIGLDTRASASHAGSTHGLATASFSSSSAYVPSSGLSAVASPALAQTPVDIVGGYVSDESGLPSSPHSVVQDSSSGISTGESVDASASALSDGAHHAAFEAVGGTWEARVSASSDLGNEPSKSDDSLMVVSGLGDTSAVDQSTTDDSQSAASTASLNESSSPSVATSPGLPVIDSESAFEVYQAAASTISQRDTTGIGRSLQSRDAQDNATTAELAMMMQTILTRTLLAAAYTQSMASSPAPSIRSRACRESSPRARNLMATLVPAIC